MKMQNTPEVDMLTVAKSAKLARNAILGFAPKIGLSVVDYEDLDRIDSFYLKCQDYRDYYRDPYNKLHKPELFRNYQGKCGVRPDRDVDMLMLPARGVTESKPVVYPFDYGHGMSLDGGLHIEGRYDPASCIKYKR